MVIALRGTSQTGSSNNGGDVTLTFDTGTPPLEDDIVVVVGGHGIATTTLSAPVPNAGGGYTQVGIHTGTVPIVGMWIKRMGSTPDLSVVCSGGGNNADASSWMCATYSGVDTTTAQDATATTAGPTTSTNPNPASITTVTDNAFVIVGAGSTVSDASVGTIDGYTDHLNANRNETNDLSAAFARIDAGPLGAENPGAWSAWSEGTWYAITAALRLGLPPSQDIEGSLLDEEFNTLNHGLITIDIASSLLTDAGSLFHGEFSFGSVNISGSSYDDTNH